METRIVQTLRPVDLGLTLGPLLHGGGTDPSMRFAAGDVWRASDTAAGPATVHLRSTAPTTVAARAWGPGAATALDDLADLLGAADDPPSLGGIHPLVTNLAKRLPGLRIGRTGSVLDALVPTVLAQRVIGAEASWAYVAMVHAAGRAARAPTTPVHRICCCLRSRRGSCPPRTGRSIAGESSGGGPTPSRPRRAMRAG